MSHIVMQLLASHGCGITVSPTAGDLYCPTWF